MSEKYLDVSVILPVHELTEETIQLFEKAVKSVEQQQVKPKELLIVVPENEELKNKILSSESVKTLLEENIAKIETNDGKTDFCSQVNFGVEKAKSEWVSILELDDEYANIWFKNAKEYIQAYPNVEIFMPLIIDVDSNNNFVSFTNEAVWAASFSEELGVLDLNALLTYQNFNIDGVVIKKSLFEDFGALKPSIKLTFVYEFLLRMAFKDVKIMTIPKFGYKHTNQRVGSLFHSYKETMDPIESRWWLNQAKKEFYFDQDRNITYAQGT